MGRNDGLSQLAQYVLLCLVRLGDGAYGVPITRTSRNAHPALSPSRRSIARWNASRRRAWSSPICLLPSLSGAAGPSACIVYQVKAPSHSNGPGAFTTPCGKAWT